MILGTTFSAFADNFICKGSDKSNYKLILREGTEPWQHALFLQKQNDNQVFWQTGTLNSLQENGQSSTEITNYKTTYNFALVVQGESDDQLDVSLGIYDRQTDSVQQWGPSLDCNLTNETF